MARLGSNWRRGLGDRFSVDRGCAVEPREHADDGSDDERAATSRWWWLKVLLEVWLWPK